MSQNIKKEEGFRLLFKELEEGKRRVCEVKLRGPCAFMHSASIYESIIGSQKYLKRGWKLIST